MVIRFNLLHVFLSVPPFVVATTFFFMFSTVTFTFDSVFGSGSHCLNFVKFRDTAPF